MELLNKDVNISFDQQSVFLLKNEFDIKYNEILLLQDDPTSEHYHKLYSEIWDLHIKIRNIVQG